MIHRLDNANTCHICKTEASLLYFKLKNTGLSRLSACSIDTYDADTNQSLLFFHFFLLSLLGTAAIRILAVFYLPKAAIFALEFVYQIKDIYDRIIA